MEKTGSRYSWLNALSLLFVLPTFYFISISVMKYALGWNGPFNSAQPLLERLGVKESLGWNINLLILFGPVISLLISLLQVLRIDWHSGREQMDIKITIIKKWFPLSIAVLSCLVLITLFVYLVGENSHL